MGTTIIGVTYNGGVVLGADSRTSTGICRRFNFIIWVSRFSNLLVVFFFIFFNFNRLLFLFKNNSKNIKSRDFALISWLKKKKLTNFGRCCDVMVGVYVANRASDKITQLTDNVYLCRSGSVTDLVPHWLYHYSSFIFINYAWLIERVWTLIVCVCFFRLQILRLSPTMFATSFINTRQSIFFFSFSFFLCYYYYRLLQTLWWSKLSLFARMS